jgi:ubiquinone/menaquinone biosynthesis C-methylase UbiE
MKQGYTVVETDIAPGSVQRAHDFAVKAGVAEQNLFLAADAENLPFKDEVFDGVFMVASLHHLPNPEQGMRELFRVTKPGGCVLVLREPASWFFYAFWPLIAGLRAVIRKRNPGEPKSKADDETMGFSRRRLKKLFLGVGFTKVRITPVDYTKKFYANVIVVLSRVFRSTINPDPAMLRLLGAIDRGIARVPLLNALAWDWDSAMEKPKR